MTICLSMIVKNESHCIARCLKSVIPYIDYWIISDTGSTDNTKDIIKDILKDIPGELHDHPWKDFAFNRNAVLILSKDKADYTLIIDADDYLVSNNDFKSLNKLAYKINIHHDNIIYSRVQLIHNSLDFEYVGILHEYLNIKNNIDISTLEDVHIVYGANGARSQNPNKYYEDALVFEKALEIEPHNSRYTFYCAQSFRDANRYAKAITYYTKRTQMGGWNEEIYISLLMIAKLTEFMIPFEINSVESAYLKAFNYLPTRVESLYYLATYCRKRNLYDKAYFYAKIASSISKPIDGLFIEPSCYDWKIQDELSIAAFYIDKKSEAKFIMEQILNRLDLPEEDRSRISLNKTFC